jgi:energy-coupling factor transporter transmembrane protein EcfT
MKRTFNWRLWLGLLLAIVAFGSYFAFFYQFPITRDVPWVSFALFLVAIALLISGWRRAPRKILASIVTVLGLFVAGAFTFLVTVGSKDLPASQAAPALGQKAPDFTLSDMQGRPVSLANLLGQSNGVVLIFYRGYW